MPPAARWWRSAPCPGRAWPGAHRAPCAGACGIGLDRCRRMPRSQRRGSPIRSTANAPSCSRLPARDRHSIGAAQIAQLDEVDREVGLQHRVGVARVVELGGERHAAPIGGVGAPPLSGARKMPGEIAEQGELDRVLAAAEARHLVDHLLVAVDGERFAAELAVRLREGGAGEQEAHALPGVRRASTRRGSASPRPTAARDRCRGSRASGRRASRPAARSGAGRSAAARAARRAHRRRSPW